MLGHQPAGHAASLSQSEENSPLPCWQPAQGGRQGLVIVVLAESWMVIGSAATEGPTAVAGLLAIPRGCTGHRGPCRRSLASRDGDVAAGGKGRCAVPELVQSA